MFCDKCGNQLPDDAVFCDKCGNNLKEEQQSAPVQEPQVQAQQVPVQEPQVQAQQAPVQEPQVQAQQAPVQEPQVQAQQVPVQEPQVQAQQVPVQEPKVQEQQVPVQEPVQSGQANEAVQTEPVFAENVPSNSKKKLLIPAVIIFMLLLAAVVFASPGLKNSVLKLFMSDDAYFQHVMVSNTEDVSKFFVDSFNTAKETTEGGAKGSLKATLGDELKSMLKNETMLDFEWFNDAKITYDAASNDKAASVNVGLELNDVKLTEADLVVDTESKKVYVSVPDFNDKAVASELEGMDDESAEALKQIMEALPDDKAAEKIIKRYIECAFSEVKGVKLDSEKIEVENIKEKLTVMSVNFDENNLTNISKAVLNELKDDKEIEKIIKDVASVDVVKENNNEMSGEEVYNEFKTAVDNALDNIDGEFAEVNVNVDFYVNSKGELVGFKVNNDEAKLECVTVEKGKKFASSVRMSAVNQIIDLSGSGKKSGSKKSGEFSLNYNGISLVNIELDDFDDSKLEKGEFKGTVTVSLNDGVANMARMAGVSSEISKFADAKLVIKGEKKKATVSAYLGEELFASLESDVKTNNNKKVKIPKDYVDSQNSEEMQKWTEEINESKFEKFVDKLEKAGLPSQYVSLLKSAV